MQGMFADQRMTYMGSPPMAPPYVAMQGSGGGGDISQQPAGRPAPRPATATGIMICSNCGGRGHVSKLCSSPKECDCCGSIKHQKVDCPHKTKVCSVCGKPGHMAIKCAKKEEFFAEMIGLSRGKGQGKGKGKGSGDPMCWDFQKGTCEHGSECRWQHTM
eukprot:TRINITY_DN14173_c1_g2_i1.p1 TRINITY_DN14173_c1_g2~~TRINITY_DN14173_c1_g2_i1.p1  ORF type:complete len:160 (+),score=31.49 TRINITY_DN14173_c1_g2_i1:99-578(+)